eukprot:gnl/MRDRNA2_/MRDRNA2_75961_c0_seq1.p1 gnl/MRDRNA2_/MRDRNA2_75961_c0~~gnl/MRDRNA2_/MRDRNA2_75961_c0_seq1.p1  ORF type:complete len:263 (+),score=32.40 gnl/MRDRNA2_/MRDRNA2_75961_c0_seq1:167-955(+)
MSKPNPQATLPYPHPKTFGTSMPSMRKARRWVEQRLPARGVCTKLEAVPQAVVTAPITGRATQIHQRDKRSTVSVPMSERELCNWEGSFGGQSCHGHFFTNHKPPLPGTTSEFDSIDIAPTIDFRVRVHRKHQGCKFRRQEQTRVITVDPWKVMFSNPSINDRFSCGTSLADTIIGLQKGSVTVEDIPKIRVVQQGGRLVTLDHRRLYCFRATVPRGATIPVVLLESPWAERRYLAQDARVYDAVRVEEDHLEHARLSSESN